MASISNFRKVLNYIWFTSIPCSR